MRMMVRAIIVTVSFGAVSASTTWAAIPLYSVEELNALASRWPTMAKEKTVLKVEGRYSTMSRTAVRFRGCDLWFRPADGTQFPELVGETGTVEVFGRLGTRRRKTVFIVEKLRERPSDGRTYRTRRSRIREGDAKGWYALAEWTKNRADFYDDDPLRERAREANLRGISVERASLSKNRPAGLFELAEKTKRLDLPLELTFEFQHEACQLLWQSYKKQGQEKLPELTAQIESSLKGFDVPLSEPRLKLQQRYWDEPLAVYKKSSPEIRSVLHRIFYLEVVLADIRSKAADDYSNGFEIANEIEKLVPERGKVAESYRDHQLDFELSKTAVLTRKEVLRLAERFRERDQANKADQALHQWLEARERRYRPEGAAGLTHLAEEYINLVDDKEKAARLLIEAYKLTPKSKEIADRLTRLDYRLEEDDWLSKKERTSRGNDADKRPSHTGTVSLGMSPDQVWKALGGAPSSVARVATLGQINEVWTYGERGRERLAIHFLRRSTLQPSEAQVVRVWQMKPR